jgi:hypothetical protein
MPHGLRPWFYPLAGVPYTPHVLSIGLWPLPSLSTVQCGPGGVEAGGRRDLAQFGAHGVLRQHRLTLGSSPFHSLPLLLCFQGFFPCLLVVNFTLLIFRRGLPANTGQEQEKHAACSLISKHKLVWRSGELWRGRGTCPPQLPRGEISYNCQTCNRTVRSTGNQLHRLQKHMSGTYWFRDSVKITIFPSR